MIDQAKLNAVAAAVAAASPKLADIDLQHALRAQFDGLRIVICSDDDIPPNVAAAAGNTRCNLYFMDAGEHCVKLTSEMERASGLVVGLIVEDVD